MSSLFVYPLDWNLNLLWILPFFGLGFFSGYVWLYIRMGLKKSLAVAFFLVWLPSACVMSTVDWHSISFFLANASFFFGGVAGVCSFLHNEKRRKRK
ncbi:hypothetical protein J7J18_04455 [bacterium]|nr:hypothetical protein [bacterium]